MGGEGRSWAWRHPLPCAIPSSAQSWEVHMALGGGTQSPSSDFRTKDPAFPPNSKLLSLGGRPPSDEREYEGPKRLGRR